MTYYYYDALPPVPNTPAAEQQKPREPWTGDGSEEPPAHVTKVRDRVGDVAERFGYRWAWTELCGEPEDGNPPKTWDCLAGNFGPFTEVLPE